MAILPIYNCFHPILKKKAVEVTEFNQELSDFIKNMFETMHSADGIGLAANQVGDNRQILIVDISQSDVNVHKLPPTVMINPVISEFSEQTIEFQEGCLSIPSFYDDVVRPEIIVVKYLDENMKEQEMEIDGLFSRVTQHEIDHLNGILFFERLSPVRRTLSKSKLRKIQKGDYESSYNMIMPNGEKKSGVK